MTNLLQRARARADQEEGFALIYTLLVVMLVTIMVTGALVVAAANIVPSISSAYSEAASAAAQSGIDGFVSYLDTTPSCNKNGAADSTNCTPPTLCTRQDNTQTGWTSIVVNASYSSKYCWTVQTTSTGFRVTSTGKVIGGGVNASRTLVADVTGGASTNLYNYSTVVGYETQAPDVVTKQFPARTVALSSAASSAANVSASSVSWNGASGPTTAVPGSVNVCNSLYAGAGGRESNPAPNATTPYVDWEETGAAGTSSVTDFQPCQVTLGSNTKLETASPIANGSGGYASHDALLLSNSYPGGSGPLLNQPVTTGYQYTPSTATPCDTADQDYRSFNLLCAGFSVNVGGSPATGSAYSPTHNTVIPTLPTSTCTSALVTSCTAPLVTAAKTCIYTGPTRILLSVTVGVTTATVTSPDTTAAFAGSPSGCYPSTVASGINGFAIVNPSALITGFLGFAVNSAGTNPVAAPSCTDSTTGKTMTTSTGWNTTCQRVGDTASSANSVFHLTGASAIAPVGASTAAANDSGCGTTTYTVPTTSRAATACDWSTLATGASLSATNYTAVRTCIKNDLAYGSQTAGAAATTTVASCVAPSTVCSTSAPSAASTANFECLLDRDLAAQNTSSGYYGTFSTPSGSPALNASRYVVTSISALASVSGSTSSTNPSASTDPLFSNYGGTSSTATAHYGTSNYTVSRQVYGCYVPDGTAITGLLATILGLLHLTATPGLYDPTDKLCASQICSGLCVTGPGTHTWGDGGATSDSVSKSTTQFSTSLTQTTWTSTTGQGVVSNFPLTNSSGAFTDATQYAIGTSTLAPGDLYVEGTASTSLAFVARNDVIVTGSLQPSTTSSALDVIADDDVRVYHPVTCASTTGVSSTTPGFCPNDITGLYSGVLSGSNAGLRPDKQYTNLISANNNVTLNAAVFALGGSTPTSLCPQPAGTPGVCGGEFSVDNYDRGAALGTLTVQGTLVMQHHGPAGHEWEINDTSGQTSRPYSGYQLDLKYQNQQTALAPFSTLIGTSGQSSSLWHVVSVSTATS